MKRCVLVAASTAHLEKSGKISTAYLEKMKSFLTGDEYVIAVDAGLNLAELLSLEVDYLIGDFDSLDNQGELFSNFPKEKMLKLPVEKDDTDSMFAARFIAERGFNEVVFFGALGGRFDHALANLAVASYLSFAGVKTIVVDEFSVLEFLKPGIYPVEKGIYGSDTFSLMPYGGNVTGVTLRGAYYPLNNATLRTDFPLGVSNKYASDFVEIAFESGTLIIIFSNS